MSCFLAARSVLHGRAFVHSALMFLEFSLVDYVCIVGVALSIINEVPAKTGERV